ncbi:hypothetical protein [Kitasatospora griseola]|uniref:hypothetical protein n=1 Tax=Kitasatospora griseola TaxID=2064 RepID=UPI00381C93A1
MKAPTFLARHRWNVLALAAGCAATVAVTVLVWPDDGPKPPPLVPAMDYSGRARLCLAFDDDDRSRTTTATARDVLHATANSQTTNIQELAIPVSAPKEASSYLAGLVAQHCNLIIAVGPVTANGVPALTAADPTLRFVLLDSPSKVPGSTATVVDPQDLTKVLTEQITAVSSPALSH